MKREKKQRIPVVRPQDGEPVLSVSREEHVISPGDVVMLPDGGIAAVERIVGHDAYVVEWQKQLGRGPWIFPISELVPV